MNKLLEMKSEIIHFIEKQEAIVIPLAKLILMLTAFLMVYFRLGYYERIHMIFIPLILAVVCAVMPMGVGVLLLSLYTLLNLYGLGLEVTLVGAAILMLCYLMYMRFAPKKSFLTVLTPVLWGLRMPYVMPMAVGLTGAPVVSVSVLVGTVVYYFFKGVIENEALFLEAGEATSSARVSVALNQVLENKEMWIVLVAFFLTTVVVYTIRRMSIKNAWRMGIYVGTTMQLVIILFGKLLIGNTSGIIALVIGTVVSLGIAIAIEFFLMDLDYTRVERVQFSDDNYYYYVKAVPKVLVSAKEKKVTTFGNSPVNTNANVNVNKGKEAQEKLAKELEIDPNLLK